METTKFEPKDNINAKAHRKEKYFYGGYQLISIDEHRKAKGYEHNFFVAVDLRLYASNAKHYACVWISDAVKGLHGAGSGIAGGYGYHKASAASAEAFQTAGIEFNEDISGRGDSAIESALDAIAEKLGYTNYFVNHTHA